ncbi:hypothetical protein RJ640_016361 [Escallonia rubra]|uniref:ALOG domain-containing protein n=1 Tax=Escallonia rubra TaxID=112253 RepID=A0AA88UMQ4_9ASTE|nr:hypothetical protein RJ640_016361 [Escallonia rubra]
MENPRSIPTTLSRYENQRRDWNMFGQHLRNHRPSLSLARCSGAYVLEFLHYLNQFGHPSPPAKVHAHPCPFVCHPPHPPPAPAHAPPPGLGQPRRPHRSPLRRLRGERRQARVEPVRGAAVRLYLRKIRDSQSKARGISYEKKKRRPPYYSSDLGRWFQEPFRSWRWLSEQPDEPPQNP